MNKSDNTKRQHNVVAIVIFYIIGIATSGFFIDTARAATFIVNSTQDGQDASFSDGLCLTNTGVCTLRAALEQGLASPNADEIRFSITGTIVLSDQLDISKSVFIDGPGVSNLTIDGNGGSFSVFRIDSWDAQGSSITISGMTITGGGNGGIVSADPNDTIFIDSCVITYNSDYNGAGGGVFNSSNTTISNTTITRNGADTAGGGIVNAGDLLLYNSTVSDNIAGTDAGGIHNQSSSTLAIQYSTISGNLAQEDGGGIVNAGTTTLFNSTISNNTGSRGGGLWNTSQGEVRISDTTIAENYARLYGGGLFNEIFSTIQFRNTIIATNTSDDCYNSSDSSISSLGFNLDSDSSCNLVSLSDLAGQDPQLGELQDNNGRTQTHALLATSPAIDSGDSISCPNVDQRGFSRPQDGDSNGVATCDIGAFELVSDNDLGTLSTPPNTDDTGGSCFIATAAYGSPLEKEVIILKEFRDKYLINNRIGSSFVDFYYRYSPPIAEYISQNELAGQIVRFVLTPIVYIVKYPVLFLMFLLSVVSIIIRKRLFR